MKAAALQSLLSSHANTENAVAMSAYMRNRFSFFGIKSQLRRDLLRDFLRSNTAPKDNSELQQFVADCWSHPEREMHYCGLEVLIRNHRLWGADDLDSFEQLIVSHSWWDTIDVIAPKILGPWFMRYPEYIEPTIKRWLQSDNIWLQRSCVLFQLKYKDKLDTGILALVVDHLSNSREFFISKAIGWMLREYAKTDATFVREFVRSSDLSLLSQREALKHL